MRDLLDDSKKRLRNVHFDIVLSTFEEKDETTAALILSRCVYTI
jgi:hypothetical protein